MIILCSPLRSVSRAVKAVRKIFLLVSVIVSIEGTAVILADTRAFGEDITCQQEKVFTVKYLMPRIYKIIYDHISIDRKEIEILFDNKIIFNTLPDLVEPKSEQYKEYFNVSSNNIPQLTDPFIVFRIKNNIVYDKSFLIILSTSVDGSCVVLESNEFSKLLPKSNVPDRLNSEFATDGAENLSWNRFYISDNQNDTGTVVIWPDKNVDKIVISQYNTKLFPDYVFRKDQ